MEEDYTKAIEDVVNRVRSVIGEPAVTQADSAGIIMEVSEDSVEVLDFEGSGKEAVSELYTNYKNLFGPPARLICRRALEKYSDSIELPDELS